MRHTDILFAAPIVGALLGQAAVLTPDQAIKMQRVSVGLLVAANSTSPQVN